MSKITRILLIAAMLLMTYSVVGCQSGEVQEDTTPVAEASEVKTDETTTEAASSDVARHGTL